MLRILAITMAACLMLASVSFAAEMKIGIVDMQIAGAQAEANVVTKKKYEALFNAQAEKISKMQKDFEGKAKKFEGQRGKLKQAEGEKQLAALRAEAQSISEKEMVLQQSVGTLQNAVAQELSALALKAAGEVAKAKGLDLILAQNMVLFSSPTQDVSKDMLEAMNRLWKADGSKVLASEVADQLFEAAKPAK